MTPEGPEEANYGRDSRDRPDPDSPGPNRDAATLTDAGGVADSAAITHP